MEFHGAAAFAAFITANTTYEHNNISDTPYTAITLGWGWATEVGKRGYSCCQRVVANVIASATLLLFDGGSVYTLGNQPHSTIARNHIHG